MAVLRKEVIFKPVMPIDAPPPREPEARLQDLADAIPKTTYNFLQQELKPLP